MSRKNRHQEDMEFEYEVPADFDEDQEQVIYVDENGNPVDEEGNPVNYVDEDGNPIVFEQPSEAPAEQYVDPFEEEAIVEQPEEVEEILYVDENGNPVDEEGNPIVYVDENGNQVDADGNPIEYVDEQGNPIDPTNQEVVMEVIDENNDEYKEDTIFEPYGDEEVVEEVFEQQPVQAYEPTPSEFVPQPNVQMYQENNQQGYNPVAFQPTNETIITPVAPGVEAVTYVEYERILPDEVMKEERVLDNSRVTPINFIERKYGQNKGVRNERAYVEYELEHPYGKINCKPVSDVEDSE